jgi:hypothetical protein
VRGARHGHWREHLRRALRTDCWHLAMHQNHDLLGRLRREWRTLGRGADARRCATAFALRHDDLALAGVVDLCDLVAVLEPRGGRSVEQRAAIVAALLADAHDPLLARALVQTLLPGIVSVTRQLGFGRGVVEDPSEALDQAISMTCELVSDWAGDQRPYAAPDLLSALRGRLRRWLLKEKDQRAVAATVPEAVAPETSSLLTRLEGLLASEHERLARLTYQRVFEERPLAELAAADRSSPQALQHELRQFATRFLL